MARIYDVVCPHCGEVYQWCKYDPPIEKCDYCGAKLAHEEHGKPVWNADVHVFGVWSTSDEIKATSERIRREFEAAHKKRDMTKLLKHRNHELETIMYARKGDYSDNAPPMRVIHCASCSEDLFASPLNPKHNIETWFEKERIVDSETMDELCHKANELRRLFDKSSGK